MLVGTVLAAAAVKPVVVAIVGVVVVAFVLAAACTVRMKGRRAPRPQGADAGGLDADGGNAEHTPTSSGVQDRWRRLAGDLEADLDAEFYGNPTTHAESSRAPSGAAAPAPHDRRDADATRFFGDPPADAEPTTPFAWPVQDPAPARRYAGLPGPKGPASGPDTDAGPPFRAGPNDATRFFGLEPESAAWAPAHTRLFGPDELDDDHTVADHSADGPTGGLLALPPASTRAVQGVAPGSTDSRPASHALDRVRERLSAVSTPQVVALTVIDSAGRVLAGTTDDDVAGELRSLMAESGLGNTADLVQPMRFADNSRGAMLLLPTGANALLGALVRDSDSDDLQATRARLRGLAHEIGAAMRAAS